MNWGYQRVVQTFRAYRIPYSLDIVHILELQPLSSMNSCHETKTTTELQQKGRFGTSCWYTIWLLKKPMFFFLKVKKHWAEFETTQLKRIKWIGQLGRVGCVSTPPVKSRGFLLGLRSLNLHSTLFGMQTHFDSDGPMGSPVFHSNNTWYLHLLDSVLGILMNLKVVQDYQKGYCIWSNFLQKKDSIWKGVIPNSFGRNVCIKSSPCTSIRFTKCPVSWIFFSMILVPFYRQILSSFRAYTVYSRICFLRRLFFQAWPSIIRWLSIVLMKKGGIAVLRRNIINKTGIRDGLAHQPMQNAQGQGHRRGIWCVAFSPIDQVVASASGPGSSMSLSLCHGSDLQ